MKAKEPFILRFGVAAKDEFLDNSLIEYSTQQCLNVVKSTGKAAIGYLPLDTETFTKTMGESSDIDSDNSPLMFLDTATETRKYIETTDSDPDASLIEVVKTLIDTNTLTEVRIEITDTDQDG